MRNKSGHEKRSGSRRCRLSLPPPLLVSLRGLRRGVRRAVSHARHARKAATKHLTLAANPPSPLVCLLANTTLHLPSTLQVPPATTSDVACTTPCLPQPNPRHCCTVCSRCSRGNLHTLLLFTCTMSSALPWSEAMSQRPPRSSTTCSSSPRHLSTTVHARITASRSPVWPTCGTGATGESAGLKTRQCDDSSTGPLPRRPASPPPGCPCDSPRARAPNCYVMPDTVKPTVVQ